MQVREILLQFQCVEVYASLINAVPRYRTASRDRTASTVQGKLAGRPSLSQFMFIRRPIIGVLGIILLMVGSRTPIEKGEQEQ
jgi:hypothetical protein